MSRPRRRLAVDEWDVAVWRRKYPEDFVRPARLRSLVTAAAMRRVWLAAQAARQAPA